MPNKQQINKEKNTSFITQLLSTNNPTIKKNLACAITLHKIEKRLVEFLEEVDRVLGEPSKQELEVEPWEPIMIRRVGDEIFDVLIDDSNTTIGKFEEPSEQELEVEPWEPFMIRRADEEIFDMLLDNSNATMENLNECKVDELAYHLMRTGIDYNMDHSEFNMTLDDMLEN